MPHQKIPGNEGFPFIGRHFAGRCASAGHRVRAVIECASSRKVMGDLVLTRRLKILGWLTTAVMLMAVIATLVTLWL